MVTLTQSILNDVAEYIQDNELEYLTVGTGDNNITLTTTDIETAVQIGSSDRNKIGETATGTDNLIAKEFILAATEPNSQPVNLSEAGIQPGINTSNDLKVGFTFFASTKDNASQWRFRFRGRVIEG